MCEALRELMAEDLKEAENIGKRKGIEEGIEKRDCEKITEMLKDGKTPKAIAEFCKYPMELILKVQKEMLVTK